MSIRAIDEGGSSSSMGTPGIALPSITVPPCDGTSTSAAQQMQHAQQELSLQQKIRELAKHYQSRR